MTGSKFARYEVTASIHPKRYWGMTPLVLLVTCVALSACKDHTPQPTCAETVKVFERNGQRVMESISGIYLREDFPISTCSSRPYSEDQHKSYYVQHGMVSHRWYDGALDIQGKRQWELKKAGKWPKDKKYAIINLPVIRFQDIDLTPAQIAELEKPPKNWWYSPALPHRRYPIDLLPNYGLDTPDPQAGVGQIKDPVNIRWAVRGSADPKWKQPYTTSCSMLPPPDWDGKDFSPEATKAKDAAWLIQAETYTKAYSGNTCRGYIWADNGKPILAMIDVPGMAVKDIDKIYAAVSKYLSQLTVD